MKDQGEANCDRRRRTWMDRPGIEPSPSRMLSGCDATTPTVPELSRPRVLNYLLRTAFSAEALSRPASSHAAAGCLTSRLSPICSKAIGPEGAASHKSFASRAGPGRTRLSTASTNQKECAGSRASFLPFCCRRTPLAGARCGQTSAAWNSAGSEAFVAGRCLWTQAVLAGCALGTASFLLSI